MLKFLFILLVITVKAYALPNDQFVIDGDNNVILRSGKQFFNTDETKRIKVLARNILDKLPESEKEDFRELYKRWDRTRLLPHGK